MHLRVMTGPRFHHEGTIVPLGRIGFRTHSRSGQEQETIPIGLAIPARGTASALAMSARAASSMRSSAGSSRRRVVQHLADEAPYLIRSARLERSWVLRVQLHYAESLRYNHTHEPNTAHADRAGQPHSAPLRVGPGTPS